MGLKQDGGRAKVEGGRAKVEGGRAKGGKGWKIEKGGKFENNKNLAGCGLCRPLQSQGSGVSDEAASKSTRQGSNLRPGDLQSLALPLSYWWLTKRGEKTPNKG